MGGWRRCGEFGADTKRADATRGPPTMILLAGSLAALASVLRILNHPLTLTNRDSGTFKTAALCYRLGGRPGDGWCTRRKSDSKPDSASSAQPGLPTSDHDRRGLLWRSCGSSKHGVRKKGRWRTLWPKRSGKQERNAAGNLTLHAQRPGACRQTRPAHRLRRSGPRSVAQGRRRAPSQAAQACSHQP